MSITYSKNKKYSIQYRYLSWYCHKFASLCVSKQPVLLSSALVNFCCAVIHSELDWMFHEFLPFWFLQSMIFIWTHIHIHTHSCSQHPTLKGIKCIMQYLRKIKIKKIQIMHIQIISFSRNTQCSCPVNIFFI